MEQRYELALHIRGHTTTKKNKKNKNFKKVVQPSHDQGNINSNESTFFVYKTGKIRLHSPVLNVWGTGPIPTLLAEEWFGVTVSQDNRAALIKILMAHILRLQFHFFGTAYRNTVIILFARLFKIVMNWGQSKGPSVRKGWIFLVSPFCRISGTH